MTDGLFDQLLDFLTQGADPLPTDREFRRGLDAWKNANPQEQAWFENEKLPWPLRRHWALKLIQAFNWERWLPLQQAIHEDDDSEGLELDVEKVKVDWILWRTETIRRYRLEALVTLAEI